MGKSSIVTVALLATLLVLSCAPTISRSGDYGKITVSFGGSSARGLATGWPGGSLPSFSLVSVTVSASDMSTVTTSASNPTGSLTLQVPAGSGRLVEVVAVPSAGLGAPAFAKAYAGSATVDIKENATTSVAIKLTLSETKILIPDLIGSVFKMADSLGGPVSPASVPYDAGFICYALDGYGRLYLPTPEGFARYTELSETAVEFIDLPEFEPSRVQGMAFSKADNRLYFVSAVGEQDFNLAYIDTLADSPTPIYVEFPQEYSAELGWRVFPPLATDQSGNLYLTIFQEQPGGYELLKLAISAPSDGVAFATVVERAANENFSAQYTGQSGVIVSICVIDDTLYLAVLSLNDGESIASRGRVVAADSATLFKQWETGWSEENFPSSPDSQFYGPICFLGFSSGKLYVADDGFSSDGKSAYVNVDRVVEVDTEDQKITNVGLQGIAGFLQQAGGTN